MCVAVPHRGSALTESFVDKIGRMLIAVPATVLALARLVVEPAGAALAPDVKESLMNHKKIYKNQILKRIYIGAVARLPEAPAEALYNLEAYQVQ
jgi:hypothetical protein